MKCAVYHTHTWGGQPSLHNAMVSSVVPRQDDDQFNDLKVSYKNNSIVKNILLCKLEPILKLLRFTSQNILLPSYEIKILSYYSKVLTVK